MPQTTMLPQKRRDSRTQPAAKHVHQRQGECDRDGREHESSHQHAGDVDVN